MGLRRIGAYIGDYAGDLVFDCGDAEDLTQRLEAAADAILNSG